MALRGLLLDRGIELPQESDMAVRVIDVATPGRDWDCARDNRCCMRTGRRNRMRYTLHSVPRDNGKPSKGESSDGSCTLGGATQRPRWGDKSGLSSARLFNTNDKTN